MYIFPKKELIALYLSQERSSVGKHLCNDSLKAAIIELAAEYFANKVIEDIGFHIESFKFFYQIEEGPLKDIIGRVDSLYWNNFKRSFKEDVLERMAKEFLPFQKQQEVTAEDLGIISFPTPTTTPETSYRGVLGCPEDDFSISEWPLPSEPTEYFLDSSIGSASLSSLSSKRSVTKGSCLDEDPLLVFEEFRHPFDP